MGDHMKTDGIRAEIDQIDSEMIELLAKRSWLVSTAGKLKKTKASVHDSKRVEQVISGIKEKAVNSGLDPKIAEQIYRSIISVFINKDLDEFRQGQNSSIKIYQNNSLHLRQVLPGAMMWAVGLDKAMLTYFELARDTSFPEHSHEAEQITLILDGELTFLFDDKEIILKAGEAVAIPSNIKHAAVTKSGPCIAVDAWSPVRSDYI